MFSGIGGFELGIQNASNRQKTTGEHSFPPSNSEDSKSRAGVGERPICVGYSEIDKYAIKVYERQFSGHKNYGDATAINPTDLPDFDLLVGGFPCQAFSIAGKRAGFDDTRGTLFFDIARILKEKQPRHLVLENVKGLLSHDSGRTFTTIIGVLTDLGYLVEWQVLNSKDFGVPQNRERVYIVGHLGNECGGKVFPIIGGNSKNLEQLIGGSQGNRLYSTDGVSTTIASQAGGQGAKTGLYAMPVLTPDRAEKRQNGRRMKENGEPAFTVTAADRHGVAVDMTRRAEGNHRIRKDGRAGTLDANYYKGLANQERPGVKEGLRIRRLTPLECERLQGFPDNWTKEGIEDIGYQYLIGGKLVEISDTQRYKMCGNAVTVNTVQAVMKRLIPCLN